MLRVSWAQWRCVEDERGRWCALFAPEGDAEADEREASGQGKKPLVLRQEADGDRCECANGEERCCPAGEDVRAEERNTEDEAASDVGDTGEQEGLVHRPYVTGGRPIVGHCDDVIYVGGCTVRDGWKDKRGDVFGCQHA